MITTAIVYCYDYSYGLVIIFIFIHYFYCYDDSRLVDVGGCARGVHFLSHEHSEFPHRRQFGAQIHAAKSAVPTRTPKQAVSDVRLLLGGDVGGNAHAGLLMFAHACMYVCIRAGPFDGYLPGLRILYDWS
jgi:hypothetical protein